MGRLFIRGDMGLRLNELKEWMMLRHRKIIHYRQRQPINCNEFLVDSGMCMINVCVGHNDFTHVSPCGKSMVV